MSGSRLVRFLSFALVGSALGCAGPAKTPIHECAAKQALEHYRGADAVTLPVRFENNMGPLFHLADVRITVDRQCVPLQSPAELIAGFAAHRPLMLNLSLQPGVPHKIAIVAEFKGGNEYSGYRFAVSSMHRIAADELKSELVVGRFHEEGDRPIVERPTFTWTGPGSSSSD
ncbi:hypothetical protein AKJ09_05805 [Labilithrix luteola]|uniref:Lipoprotein n=1 Tax=Labilithrix luteola TaxID=1391654 RepID=A0A0K1Q0G9_9BACT|nr:hypothetical protein [Labilithrix luteola]AKU99141.1 hypothetical protein AKJ09_05805 [Labilithrix luteola]